MKQSIKFMWNGIKVNGTLYRCWYSDSKLTNHPEATITIYAKDYKSLPVIDGLQAQNDTDIMTDYFEKDRIRVTPDNQYYASITQAMDKMKEHNDRRYENMKRRLSC